MAKDDSAVLTELQKMNRLLALVVTGAKKQVEQIAILSNAGFQPTEIAELLGTTSNTVGVTLSRLRKAGKKKR
jgi:DNA-directed RNA polymerase specialized sigma24 family protein